jgi:monofunctional glycosyltransferase
MKPNTEHYKDESDIKPVKTKRWRRFLIVCLAAITVLFLILLTSIISLRCVNPPFTSFTLRENWEELGSERYNLRDWWIPRDELPHHLKWAVIASEDQNFHNHRGFDFESIQEAIDERREGVRHRGASTISQQVAKNLFLWPGTSYLRKAIEAGITILVEIFWSKDRILEIYLNIAEFGPGVFGVGKAADEYFGISPADLKPDMSARLAAVLSSPKRMRVEPPSPYTQVRSEWILRQMTHLTGISYLPPIADEPEDEPDPLPPGFEFFFNFNFDIDTLDPQEALEPLPLDFYFEPENDTLTVEEDADTLYRE